MAGIKNNKALGQHWLRKRLILDDIADLAREGNEAKVCYEIGPGLGTLTSSLLRRFERVVAIEYDAELARKLPGQFPGKNLEVINADVLQCDFGTIGEPYVVAGNIPYYITSPIVEQLITAAHPAERIVLLIQKEVAERIAGHKGVESRMSLMVKNRASVELGPVVMRDEFTPPPKVDSQVLVLMPFADGPKYPEEMFEMVSAAFASPRKKLVHNLAGLKSKDEIIQILTDLGIDVNVRPAELDLTDYYNIFKKL